MKLLFGKIILLYIAISSILVFKFSGWENNFQKTNRNLVTDFGITYDYQSIRHCRKQEEFFFIREHTLFYETSDLVFGPVYLKQKH